MAAEAAIVRPMVTMAYHLRWEMIAEDIETAEQVAFLHRLGCEEGQGYFYSEAVTKRGFEHFLSREYLQVCRSLEKSPCASPVSSIRQQLVTTMVTHPLRWEDERHERRELRAVLKPD